MKLTPKALALMAALAAGAASAQGATPVRAGNETNAGTIISNTATASYTDPTDPTKTATTDSNTVTTTVAERMGFDVTYTSGTDSATTDDLDGAELTRTDVVTGSTIAFPYVVVNNGNATQEISLSSDPAATGVSNVKFYLSDPDTNKDGVVDSNDTAVAAVTAVEVKPSGYDPKTKTDNTGMVNIWMSYTVTGNPGATVGTTPIGTGQVWDTDTKTTITVTEQRDMGTTNSTTTVDDLWWQYSKVTLFKPELDTTPQAGVTTTVDTPPTGGTNERGYMSGTTPVQVDGDQQIAYPKADFTTTKDTVVFTNTVKNSTAKTDTVTLSILPITSILLPTLPSGYSQTVTPTGNTGEYAVEQTNPDGIKTTATVLLSTTSTTLNADSSVNYTVTVTYDDPYAKNAHPIYVAIGVDSGLDNNSTPDAYTFDTVMPPAMDFGDTATGVGAAANDSAGDLITKPGTPGSTVDFPMDIGNPGEYADTYTLSGYTVVTLADGSKKIAAIDYKSGGTLLPTSSTTTVVVDLNGDGDTTDAGETVVVPLYTTSAVNPNSETNVTASVTLDADTALTSTGYTLNQTATAVYSGISLTDTNDKITVAASGSLLIAKFTQGTASGTEYAYFDLTTDKMVISSTAPASPTSYITNPSGSGYTALNATSFAPGVQYSYQIIAKNTYNAQVLNFFVLDTLNTNLQLVSVLGTISGNTESTPTDASGTTVIYSSDGTTWSTTPQTTGSKVYVAVDDPSRSGLQPGALDRNAQLTATITVLIK